MLRVGTRALVHPVDLKVVLIAANVLRAVTTANAAHSAVRARAPAGRRKADRAASVRRATPRIGPASGATVHHAGTMVSVRPAGLKAAAIVANALRVALMANAARALRAALRAAASATSVRRVALKAVRIVASAARAHPAASREARTETNAHPAGLRAATVRRAGTMVSVRPAASKATQIAATARPAVSKATAPRVATTANVARSAGRARVSAVRRKADRAASVRRATPRIGPASAATVAPRRSAAVLNAGRAATAHRAVLTANVAIPGVASALSRSPSKVVTVTEPTVRRVRRATTAANGHRPDMSSAIVRRVPASVTSAATGANGPLAASTRRCRPPAAALAMTTALPVPTNRAARRPQPEPNATMTPTSLRARRAAITKTRQARCACPS
ncbi:hypothetical protein LMG28690_00315 [Paraburkholderia caffeinilytica]|nr:hypothetical protein LMG28690_00315 [Paraburkholderia caffeinilytica]